MLLIKTVVFKNAAIKLQSFFRATIESSARSMVVEILKSNGNISQAEIDSMSYEQLCEVRIKEINLFINLLFSRLFQITMNRSYLVLEKLVGSYLKFYVFTILCYAIMLKRTNVY